MGLFLRLGIAGTLLLMLGPPPAVCADEIPAPVPREQRKAALGEFLDGRAERGEFSGVALVADADGILLRRAWGMADQEWQVPNTVDTRFRIGSLTKNFTAAAVLSLVDRGRLSLDEPLAGILPWYRQDTGRQVTLRQLLNHTSGIDRSSITALIQEHGRVGLPLKEVVTGYCSGDLEWEPGTRMAYNNGGYLILGAVIEEVTDLPYGEALRRLVLEPAGLADTEVDDSRRVVPRRAHGYERVEGGLRKPEFIQATLAGSAGGILSTADDLLRWDQVLHGDTVLSDAARREIGTPGLGSAGFGWFIMDVEVDDSGGTRTVWRHPGQGDGFHSIVWRIPQDEVVVILLHNLGKTDLVGMAQEILAIVYAGATTSGRG